MNVPHDRSPGVASHRARPSSPLGRSAYRRAIFAESKAPLLVSVHRFFRRSSAIEATIGADKQTPIGVGTSIVEESRHRICRATGKSTTCTPLHRKGTREKQDEGSYCPACRAVHAFTLSRGWFAR